MKILRGIGLCALLIAVVIGATSCELLAAYGVYETASDIAEAQKLMDGRTRQHITFSLTDDAEDVTEEELHQVEVVLEARLSSLSCVDYDIDIDEDDAEVTVEIVWDEDEEPDDPESIAQELGQPSMLEFRKGAETTFNADGDTVPAGELIVTGSEVVTATVVVDSSTYEPTVMLTFTERGKAAFADATAEQARVNGTISIWLDGEMIFNPTVHEAITEGEVMISGVGTQEEAEELVHALIAAGRFFSGMEIEECTTIHSAG